MRLGSLVAYLLARACSTFATSSPHHTSTSSENITPVSVSRRWDLDPIASDEVWSKAKCRGERLVELMVSSDAEAGPKLENTRGNEPPSARSEWQGELREELRTWGWHDFKGDDLRGDLEGTWHVASVVDALRINGRPKSEGGNNIAYDVRHVDPFSDIRVMDQRYHVDGKEYRATSAQHSFVVNPVDGVIIGQFLESPASAAKRTWYRNAADEELPKLRSLSDIFWGYWVRGNRDVSRIRYFWMMDVENRDTEEILGRAMSEANQKLQTWPGTVFTMDSDAGRAILGSANGAVFAWFLAQHKAQLGNKWISKVTVFMDDRAQDWHGAHLVFWVEDVPQHAADVADAVDAVDASIPAMPP